MLMAGHGRSLVAGRTDHAAIGPQELRGGPKGLLAASPRNCAARQPRPSPWVIDWIARQAHLGPQAECRLAPLASWPELGDVGVHQCNGGIPQSVAIQLAAAVSHPEDQRCQSVSGRLYRVGPLVYVRGDLAPGFIERLSKDLDLIRSKPRTSNQRLRFHGTPPHPAEPVASEVYRMCDRLSHIPGGAGERAASTASGTTASIVPIALPPPSTETTNGASRHSQTTGAAHRVRRP
jgi:hypothetical protein